MAPHSGRGTHSIWRRLRRAASCDRRTRWRCPAQFVCMVCSNPVSNSQVRQPVSRPKAMGRPSKSKSKSGAAKALTRSASPSGRTTCSADMAPSSSATPCAVVQAASRMAAARGQMSPEKRLRLSPSVRMNSPHLSPLGCWSVSVAIDESGTLAQKSVWSITSRPSHADLPRSRPGSGPLCSVGVGVEPACHEGEPHQPRHAVRAGLLQHAGAVEFHRARTDVEPARDHLV